MKVAMTSSDRTVAEWDIPFEVSENTNNRVWFALARLWKDACRIRDLRDVKADFRFTTTVPMGDAEKANANAIFTINSGEFFKSVQYLLNAYVPQGIGTVMLRTIFDSESHCIMLDELVDHARFEGKVSGFPTMKYGIFAFHFFEGKVWAEKSADAIANICTTIPFDVQDYSVICNAVRRCPVGAHPFVWLNPYLAMTWKSAYDSKVTMRQIQFFVSSFIIVSAYNAGDTIDDQLITQLWEALDNFIETEDFDSLNTLYQNAEECLLIDSGHARIADVPDDEDDAETTAEAEPEAEAEAEPEAEAPTAEAEESAD